MNPTEWHIPADTLEDYLDGVAGHVRSASVESHLMACADCRASLAAQRGPSDAAAERAELVWQRIEDRIDRPRIPEVPGARWATTTLSSPPLRVVTVVLALALAGVPGVIGSTNPRAGVVVLVALAPLAPLIGAALAFRTELDPAGAMCEATPLASGRLTVQRAAVLTVVSLLAGMVGSLFVPLPLSMLASWLLPGLALCTVLGATATVVEPLRVAVALGLVWTGLVAAWSLRTRALPVDLALVELPTAAASVQWTLLVVAAGCAALWGARRDVHPNWRRT
jgi:predicted anti-sigma-YlaC factor YlaD